jgi:hypothetical protein
VLADQNVDVKTYTLGILPLILPIGSLYRHDRVNLNDLLRDLASGLCTS